MGSETTTITSLFTNITEQVLNTTTTNSNSTTFTNNTHTTLLPSLLNNDTIENSIIPTLSNSEHIFEHVSGVISGGDTCLTYWEQQTVIFTILIVCLAGYLIHTLRYNI